MSEPAPASADGGAAAAAEKVRRAATLLARCHARPCMRVQASAGQCSMARVQNPASLPFFLLGGSAQLSFRARVRRIGASDGELGRGSRHRPSLSCQSSNPGSHHGSQLHRCKRASEPPHKSNLAGACKMKREREKPTAHISPRLACCSRARTQHSQSPSAPTPAPSWPAAQPLLQHQKLLATHPTCRRSAQPKLSIRP